MKSKGKEQTKKGDKTPPAKSLKEKKADKMFKKNNKNKLQDD